MVDAQLLVTIFVVGAMTSSPTLEEIEANTARLPHGRAGYIYRYQQRWWEVISAHQALGEHSLLSELLNDVSGLLTGAQELWNKLQAFAV